MPYDPSRITKGYEEYVAGVRARLSDDVIEDALERYMFGAYDRYELMEALDLDYIGMTHELIAVYQPMRPEPDAVEEARQTEMVRMILNGEVVPIELRQPASWRTVKN